VPDRARFAIVTLMLAAGHAGASAAHSPDKVCVCGSFRNEGTPVPC
jgi:hypothetical protein